MINLEHVSFGYIKQPMLFIDLNLKMQNGNLILMGQEGAGKTTLLELLCGMQTLYVGKIEVCKNLPQNATANITYLPSDVVALNNKTVLQNLQFACDAINKGYDCINMQDDFVSQFANTKIKKLSNFNKAIFALKRAEIKSAKVLLIDVCLQGFSGEEIAQYAQILNGILKDNSRVVILAINSQDFKQLNLEIDNSLIAYLFATKMYLFNNLKDYESKINYMGMAEYLNFASHCATISVNQSGNFLNVLNRTIKLEDKYVQKIVSYFDELTISTKVKVYTNLDLQNLSDQQINEQLDSGKILLFDNLTTERLN